ncbi:hypothetical protein BASA50_009031 [Batrachochytrium salamandrivorans]|uniref:4'-phosphopantetheinyl transferase domain-containing protein n=1 Tax=Batrachochytrium salamandrivorans TaxID=1357716 RepID=A0ABQ8F5Q3_9FUNG|nr:hypothetical protein BASA50_009031 [Batrachochytrium salamandrivorans]
MWRVAGVGVDMLQLSRMAGLLQRQSPLRLARRILHPLEQDQLMAEFGQSSAADAAALSVPLALHPESDGAVSQWQLRLVRYLGTRWAIKEAAFKAMYPKVRLDWHQAVITKQQGDAFHSTQYDFGY